MNVWTSCWYGFRSEPQPLAQPWPWPFSSCGSDSNARLSLSRCSILQLKQICLQKRSQKWFCKCRNLKLEYFCASPIYNAAHKPVRHSYGALMSSLFIDEFRFLNIESLSLSLDVFCEKHFNPSSALHCGTAQTIPWSKSYAKFVNGYCFTKSTIPFFQYLQDFTSKSISK